MVESRVEVAGVHHSQDVPHLQVLSGGMEGKMDLRNNLNISTLKYCQLANTWMFLYERNFKAAVVRMLKFLAGMQHFPPVQFGLLSLSVMAEFQVIENHIWCLL